MWKRRQAPCADDQTTRLGHRFATGQKPATDPLAAQALVQTRHHKRSFGRFGTRNTLQLATPDLAAPAGVGRPATARSSHVPGRPGRSIDHGPGARANDMPGPGVWHTVHAVIHPCATRGGPGKKFSGCRTHARGRRTHAVKCAQMPLNSYLRPLPVRPPGCVRRASGRAGIAGGVTPSRAAPLQDGRQKDAARRERFHPVMKVPCRVRPHLLVGGCCSGAGMRRQREGSAVRRTVRKASCAIRAEGRVTVWSLPFV